MTKPTANHTFTTTRRTRHAPVNSTRHHPSPPPKTPAKRTRQEHLSHLSTLTCHGTPEGGLDGEAHAQNQEPARDHAQALPLEPSHRTQTLTPNCDCR